MNAQFRGRGGNIPPSSQIQHQHVVTSARPTQEWADGVNDDMKSMNTRVEFLEDICEMRRRDMQALHARVEQLEKQLDVTRSKNANKSVP